jgi:hypothetical protein
MAPNAPNAPFIHSLQAALGAAIVGLLLYSWISLIDYLDDYRAALGLNIGAVGILKAWNILSNGSHH